MRNPLLLFFSFCILSLSAPVCAKESAEKTYEGKKIYWVESYNDDYPWTQSLEQGIQEIFKGKGLTLKTFHMDTKRNPSLEHAEQKALEAKAEIEEFKPDILFFSDDNATKYVLMPSFKDSDVPTVFCGINWDISLYGLPYKNTTGMIEISPTHELLTVAKPLIKNNKVSVLSSDQEVEHKEISNIKSQLGVYFYEERYVTTFEEWKSAYLDLQNSSGFIILRNNANLAGWDDDEAKKFVETHTTIATGALLEWMAPYALISVTIKGTEPGVHMAKTALKILSGTAPKDIPIVPNVEGNIILNERIAKRMSIAFPESLVDLANDHILK